MSHEHPERPDVPETAAGETPPYGQDPRGGDPFDESGYDEPTRSIDFGEDAQPGGHDPAGPVSPDPVSPDPWRDDTSAYGQGFGHDQSASADDPYGRPDPYAHASDYAGYGGYAGYGAFGGRQGQADPYYGHPGYADPYYGQAWPQQPRSRVPGWLWPVVAVMALLVGLVGGTLGGALVSSSVSDGGSGVPSIIDSDRSEPAPLEPENGSVAAVAQALLPSTVQVLSRGGSDGAATGSGFIIDKQGHVITNNHVVANAAENDGRVRVVDHAGRTLDAEVVGRSPVYDIAVLAVAGAGDLQPAALGSSRAMNIGETVVAIGSPLGLSSTVTSGIVSAVDRPVTTGAADESSYINAVQTDAAINPGNSGGPLVNLRGEVVGVNSAIATVGGFGGRAGNIGVGFAIPMEQVEVTATQILSTGEAKYPVIGANVNTGSRKNGAEIVDVPAGTPAATAGLEEGDIVVGVDETTVTDGIELIVAIRSHQPGETITLRVKRDGLERSVDITLDAQVG